eukprot:gene6179-7408_t
MGAGRGYSLLNGVAYYIMCLFGMHALLDAIIPHESVLGVICFVGAMISTADTDVKNPAIDPYIYGRGFSVLVEKNATSLTCENSGVDVKLAAPYAGENLVVDGCYPDPVPSHSYTYGVTAMTGNYLVIGLVWANLFMYVTDRRFFPAAIWAAVATLFSVLGLMHTEEANLKNLSDHLPNSEDPERFRFAMCYSLMFAVCVLAHAFQTYCPELAVKYTDYRVPGTPPLSGQMEDSAEKQIIEPTINDELEQSNDLAAIDSQGADRQQSVASEAPQPNPMFEMGNMDGQERENTD